MEDYLEEFTPKPLLAEKKDFLLKPALEALAQEEKETKTLQYLNFFQSRWKLVAAALFFILVLSNYSLARWEQRVLKQYTSVSLSPIPLSYVHNLNDREAENNRLKSLAFRHAFLQRKKFKSVQKYRHFSSGSKREN